jgi:hypothetical protein
MTLLELLLALGLIVLVSVMMFLFYDQILRSRDRGRRYMTEGYLARVVAHKIADEIRAADGFLFGIGPGVSGKERELVLQSVTLPDKDLFKRAALTDRPPPGQCDIREVKYYLAYDQDQTYTYHDGTDGPAPMGLVRSEMRTLFQPAVNEENEESLSLDLLSPEIKYLRIRYFDGAEWLDRWQLGGLAMGRMSNTLPQAVEVTVGYDELPPLEEEELDFDENNFRPADPEPYSPRTYTVTVWLPQADVFLGARLLRAQLAPSSDETEKSGGAAGS